VFPLGCNNVSGVDGLYQNLAKVVECHRGNSVCAERMPCCHNIYECLRRTYLATTAVTSVCAERTLPPLQLPVSAQNIPCRHCSYQCLRRTYLAPTAITIVCVEHVCLPLWLSVRVGKLSYKIAVSFFLDKALPLCFNKYKSSVYTSLFVINHQ